MTFIKTEVQIMYFEAHYSRRQKRDLAGCTSTEEHRLLLDKCLDIILCHDPDIWSKGTGVLLIANKTPERLSNLITLSQKRALHMRIEARDCHHYDRESRLLIEESFGFFVRKTIEYRDRMRNYAYEMEYANGNICQYLEINYIENMSPVIENFDVQADASRCAGIRRHGLDFDILRQVTKRQTDNQIIDEISEVFVGSSYFLHILRNALEEYVPEIFNNLSVRRELSFEDVYEDDYEDDYEELKENCTCIVPELVETNGECIVCFEEGKVLQWPCYFTHVVCKKCTDKIVAIRAFCPLCRQCMLVPNPI